MKANALKIRIAVFMLAATAFAIAASAVFAGDFGLILNQGFILADQDYLDYSAAALPWFAAPLGEQADLYLSAGAGAEYEDKKWNPRYEVYRFELTWNPSANLSFGFGRQNFQDSLGLIMTGLFDGISTSVNMGGGRLDAGLFYTGLLYKETASITLSQRDQDIYNDSGVYFAPRRLATGVNWEKTSIFDSQMNLWLSGICQIDLNDTDIKVHSQYLAAKFSFPLGVSFNVELGAMAELLEERDKDLRAACAAAANIQWLFYGDLSGILSMGGRFSSGESGNTLAAFTPLTGVAQGKVLRPNFSGIALAQVDYTARLPGGRLWHGLFMELYAAYLFRTDTNVSSNSPFLGGEFYVGLSWLPFSDIVFSLGGGVFLPQTGKAFADDAGIKYRLEATAGISL